MAIELLSPAGNYEKLETAFNYGADAAYMGLTKFSLRANAGNFPGDELEKVKAIKEKSGKRLYCTMNILFRQPQIEELESMREEIARWPFDAFIVSDIGTVSFFQKYFPEKELHLSTQASCINSESARMYYNMGFKRVILGREASLDDIKRIKDRVPELQLEAFVHGAMCMAYSGRCILSACLTGRSANRGDCSHTCRWNYRLHYALEEEERPGHYYPIEEGENYTAILSSKDLCMIDHLDDLKNAGLDSLKIEGRMKSIYYTAVVTRAYRKALDNDPDAAEYRKDIFDVSHREFTTGFFYSSDAFETKEDVSKPTSYGYERNYMFLGSVGKEIKDGVWEINCRNHIRRGDEIEFIGPDVPLLREEKVTLLDENGFPLLQLDHMKKGFIKTTLPLREGYIIRKLSDVKYV